MANGTTDEKRARADRIRDQSALAQKQAEQHRKATANAIAAIRRQPGAQPYREEMDSVSEVTAPWMKARLPLGRTARTAIGFAIAVFILCVGAALVLRILR